MPRFKDLTKIVFRENHDVFLFGCIQGRVTNVEQISADGQVWTVLFKYPEREQASAARLFDALHEICCGQLFPVNGKFGLAQENGRSENYKNAYDPFAHVFASQGRNSSIFPRKKRFNG
jgi:hypothetical protein